MELELRGSYSLFGGERRVVGYKTGTENRSQTLRGPMCHGEDVYSFPWATCLKQLCAGSGLSEWKITLASL